jgi:hypothetical protein
MATNTARALMNFYKSSLLVVVPLTGTLGLSSGLSEIFSDKEKKQALFEFSNIIAYTTLGTLVGITYPITFPLITFETFRN